MPLIPRYFDLLLLLVERRREAVHRREIFDRVWGDVIVSDSALSQAVRTIRRTLGDDSREPRFIRTISPATATGSSSTWSKKRTPPDRPLPWRTRRQSPAETPIGRRTDASLPPTIRWAYA